jgi:hypothetical protein
MSICDPSWCRDGTALQHLLLNVNVVACTSLKVDGGHSVRSHAPPDFVVKTMIPVAWKMLPHGVHTKCIEHSILGGMRQQRWLMCHATGWNFVDLRPSEALIFF